MHKHTAEYFSTPVGPEKTHEEIFFLIIIHKYSGRKLSHMLIIRLIFIFINITFKNIMINHNILRQTTLFKRAKYLV